jgi:dienelactone hydrolase
MRPAPEQRLAAADSYAGYIREQARARLGRVVAPATLEGWDDRLSRVRAGLARSFGRMPEISCPLEPEIHGTLLRDGYAIERLTFQTRPGVRVTANLYRPEPAKGPYPAMLSVHGHWAWARMDPHVQPRCIGLARLGYVVLCVDAFGAGERAIEPGPGTYHGALIGASLWPIGTPLLGLQVYDNRRAVDYLISRPEVDRSKLAVTGASGGGNQTLYAGATDDRFAAVIPVCGVGTYESYLGTACCVCEVNVAGAAYATTGDLLAMIAPRALLVVSASSDAVQFSAGEAAKSISHASGRYRLLSAESKIRHVTIESGHDYNKPMREAMYGWVEKWLCGRGNGDPIRELEVKVEDVSALRCFADAASRPSTIVTIPEWAFREGTARLDALANAPDHIEHWRADAERIRSALRDDVLGGFPAKTPVRWEPVIKPGRVDYSVESEPGIRLRCTIRGLPGPKRGTVLLTAGASALEERENGVELAEIDRLRRSWDQAGFETVVAPCRDIPKLAPIAGVADHTAAEWGVWVGRPLLGQWVWDIIRWLDLLDRLRTNLGGAAGFPWPSTPRPYYLVGRGAIGLAAVLAAALDDRVAGVSCDGGLVSFVAEKPKPWSDVPMSFAVPNILSVGDVAHLGALIAPRPLVFSRPFDTDGTPATRDRTLSAFAFCRAIFQLMGAADRLKLVDPAELHSLVAPR